MGTSNSLRSQIRKQRPILEVTKSLRQIVAKPADQLFLYTYICLVGNQVFNFRHYFLEEIASPFLYILAKSVTA